jgi:type IV pilus assembly protein PilB
MIKGGRRRLGEILVDAHKITEEDLLRATNEQAKYGEKLGEVMVKMGLVTDGDIVAAVSEQLKIPVFDLDHKEVSPEIIRLIPQEMVKNYRLIPVERHLNVLKIAMVDPLDINASDAVARAVRMEIELCLITDNELNRALEKYYGSKTRMEESLDRMKEGSELAFARDDEEREGAVSVDVADQAPIVRFVNSLLSQALQDGASDIHVERGEKAMRLRMRIDGKLREIPAPDKRMFLPIISRIKILSGIDISKTRVPQDGRFNIRQGSKEVGLRVSTFPTIHGEKAVLRLLDKSPALFSIEKLGFLPLDEETLKEVLTRPYGFILSTGPTGSGKSTTLYAILNHINSPEKNIITIEDPVEYTVDGLTQSQVNPKAGLTFESGLRSILRQDPDVIMVGEIRDAETATIAVHSALTGHLVLSTLHTNDAAGAVTRLVEMGIEPFLVSSSVSCVIGQRLLRKICEDCKVPYHPGPIVRKGLNIGESVLLFEGKGCPKCNNSGYRGRIGIYEILVMDDDIRDVVVSKGSAEMIRKRGVEKGMALMRDDAMAKVLMGMTTIEEAMSVTQAD